MQLRRKIYNVYNKSPYILKKRISYIGKVIPPNYLLGKSYSETLSYIKDSEFASKDNLVKLCNDQLGDILIHALLTSPFYRKKMMAFDVDEAKIRQNPQKILSRLGFIDKKLVIENFDEFLSNSKSQISCDYVSTGGTTGEPFYFFINSDRSSKEWAFINDQWSRIGYSLQSKRATFRGSKIESDGWEDDWITKERKFSSFNLTDQYLLEIWPSLHEFKPEFVYAYPSTAILICRFMERRKKKLPDTVKAWLLGSENIYDGQREYIEEISDRRIFMWYGHSEKIVLAAECENSNYYHAYPQYGYVEFINEQGNQAKPGEFAEIVGTGFINTVMPFIRYRTGDFCTYLGDHCPKCERNYHIFEKIRGRWTQEVLIGDGGNQICMSAINVHSDNMKNVFRFQFHQTKSGVATLRIVPKQGFCENDRRAIEKEFNLKFNGSVEINTQVVYDIDLTKLGKWKFIDQEIKIDSIHS